MKINSVNIIEVDFLKTLSELAYPPAHIYYLGALPNQRPPVVAIVGTRKPTPYGKQVTYDLAYKLAQRGVTVVSGLAFGIDAIAHRAALDAGGTTIAILPGGLDQIYPASHSGLAKEIIKKGGAIISEYPEGTGAHKHHFLARNRIVSGLADAIIVSEAGERSGTLSTVNHALDQNREVFAVPGPITSLQSIGPNRLIEQGAHPVLSVESILEVIAPHLLDKVKNFSGSPLEEKVVNLLEQGVKSYEQLLKKTVATPSDFAVTLTNLELLGVVRSIEGNSWTLQ